MSKKLWKWCYLKQPVDYMDLLRSENIDKGKKMHEAISKRMKEIIASGPPLKFIKPAFFPTTYTDNVFDMIPEYIKQCDCEMKILKNRTPVKPVTEWFIDSEAKFDENIIKDLNIVYDGPAATGKVEKLSTRWSIIDRPSNEKYNFINFSIVNDPIDPKTKIKSCNPQGEQYLDPYDVPAKQENKSSQVSICSSCNYYNEWIPFDPNYKCYKCKNGL